MERDSRDSDKDRPTQDGPDRRSILVSGASLLALVTVVGSSANAEDQPKPSTAPSGGQPNVLFIMGDDIGWFNIGAYNRGMMAGKTPNLDKLAAKGMRYLNAISNAPVCAAARRSDSRRVGSSHLPSRRSRLEDSGSRALRPAGSTIRAGPRR